MKVTSHLTTQTHNQVLHLRDIMTRLQHYSTADYSMYFIFPGEGCICSRGEGQPGACGSSGSQVGKANISVHWWKKVEHVTFKFCWMPSKWSSLQRVPKVGEAAGQTDNRLTGNTCVRSDEQDRQAMVPPEMQMSKLLAVTLHIRHQSVRAAPLAAVLWGRELWLFKIIIF